MHQIHDRLAIGLVEILIGRDPAQGGDRGRRVARGGLAVGLREQGGDPQTVYRQTGPQWMSEMKAITMVGATSTAEVLTFVVWLCAVLCGVERS